MDEYGDKFQGDMVLSKEQRNALSARLQSGLLAKQYRWPEGIVAYNLSSGHTGKQQKQIKTAMQQIELVSCIKFIQHTNETDYIQFTVGSNEMIRLIELVYCLEIWA